ncbi:MAG: hypothetical protein A2033_10755 [Bacteroidetes bacterium GWA2_31_9]|nr:MAG: hypothetical protein A2033_10755 [Bacteroidetes bacterium GWA2_31_9]
MLLLFQPVITKKFLRKFIIGFFSKEALILIISCLLFFYFNQQITTFIGKYLVTSLTSNNIYLTVLTIVIVVFLISFQLIKITDRYKPAFEYWFILLAIIGMHFYYRVYLVNVPWSYLRISELKYLNCAYLDIIYASLLIFPIVYFTIWFKNLFRTSSELSVKNINIEDNPIENTDDDKIGYDDLVKRITGNVLHDIYNKSFTIGIVGPWGNGKSSLIKLVQNKIKENKPKNIVEINFYPFLNHNDEDIITEFFKSLSSKLEKYDGSLSKQLFGYADKLIQLYKKGDIKYFLDKHISLNSNTPAYNLYEEINSILKKINKKIIVYIDDLDRLNEKEIIQVLKLIRNTANFNNTVFIVAMDKKYVVDALKNSKDFQNERFVDKFFQLEVYLPEIKKSILLDLFEKLIFDSNEIEPKVKEKIKIALTRKETLFRYYISNIRDVKKLANQLIFENTFINDEINYTDFINFIFLKTHYPKFIQSLNTNRAKFLNHKNGFYYLNEKSPENENRTEALIKEFNRISDESSVEIDKYDIANLFKIEDNCYEKQFNLNCWDKELLLITLVELFGNQSPTNPDSIQHEYNFSKLMRLSFEKNDLRKNELDTLLSFTDFEDISKYLIAILKNNKGRQLIEQIKYIEPKTKEDLKTLTIILILCYNFIEEYQLFESDITYSLSFIIKPELYDRNSSLLKNEEWVSFIKKVYFESQKIKLYSKVRLLNLLWTNKGGNKLWGVGETYIKEIALKYFDEYLSKFNVTCWEKDDFKIFHIYNSLKDIGDIKNQINIEYIKFLKNNNLTVFCSQMLDTEAVDGNYKINNFVVGLFGSYDEFFDFVKKSHDNGNQQLNEFIEYLELMKITEFRGSLKYKFNDFPIREYPSKNYYYGFLESYKNLVQFFFEFNTVNIRKANDKLIDFTPLLTQLDLVIEIFQYDNKHFMFFFKNENNAQNEKFKIINMYASRIYNVLKSSIPNCHYKEITEENSIFIFDNDGIEIAKLKSYQV